MYLTPSFVVGLPVIKGKLSSGASKLSRPKTLLIPQKFTRTLTVTLQFTLHDRNVTMHDYTGIALKVGKGGKL